MFALQASLFATCEPEVDPDFGGIERVRLDEWSWLDHLPGWLRGADDVFEKLRGGRVWQRRRVVMYHRVLDEPSLSWWHRFADGGTGELPAVLVAVRAALSARYGRMFDSVGANYYRDGRDSVAWHGDRNRFWSDDPIIAIVSTGEPRPFLPRPRDEPGPGEAGPYATITP